MLQDADQVLIGPYWYTVRRLAEPPAWARALGCDAKVEEEVHWFPYEAVSSRGGRGSFHRQETSFTFCLTRFRLRRTVSLHRAR